MGACFKCHALVSDSVYLCKSCDVALVRAASRPRVSLERNRARSTGSNDPWTAEAVDSLRSAGHMFDGTGMKQAVERGFRLSNIEKAKKRAEQHRKD